VGDAHLPTGQVNPLYWNISCHARKSGSPMILCPEEVARAALEESAPARTTEVAVAELKIVTCPAPILFRQARAVSRVGPRVRRLAHDMLATMYAASGVGLAAPQVGVGKRLIVVDVGLHPLVLVNPEITSAEGEQVGLEGCLSLPDLVGEVRRAEWVMASGFDRLGRPITVEGQSLLARVLQHEIDHLDGILFIARIEDPTRLWKVSELSTAAKRATAHL
jgi:peptide deformylase